MRLLPRDVKVGWAPYAWLAYLSLFVVYPWLRGATAAEWVACGAGVVVFLVLYFRGFWLRGRSLLWVVGGIAALGFGYAPFNPGAASFFVYAAAFLGEVGPPRIAFRWLAVLLAGVGLETWVLGLSAAVWVPSLIIPVIVGAPNIYFAQARRDEVRLREAQAAAARLTERERIAGDLHDLLGHTLSVIVLKSELASKLAASDPGRAVTEIREVERISREALAEVRQAVTGYRDGTLSEERARARVALEAAGIALVENVQELPMPAPVERALALALREAVTNVVRHAGAGRCWISLAARDGRVVLEIRDDGVGGAGPEGSGLAGMRARLATLDGTVDRDGARGTRLRVAVPIPDRPTPAPSTSMGRGRWLASWWRREPL